MSAYTDEMAALWREIDEELSRPPKLRWRDRLWLFFNRRAILRRARNLPPAPPFGIRKTGESVAWRRLSQ